MRRAQLKHVLLDVDFFDKPTIRALGYKHSQIAVLLFIRWMMLMSRATNGLVTRDALASVAREVLSGTGTAIANFESVLNYCVETGMIYEEGDGHFTNERVVKDQESCAVKRKSSNERQKKFREKERGVDNASLTRLSDTVTAIDNINKLEIVIPEFQDPKISKAITRWRQHRQKLGKPFDQMALDALQSLYRGRANELLDDIDHSISNGWKTLNAKSRDKPQAQAPQIRQTLQTYIPPTESEKARPSEESKRRVRELIAKTLEKKKSEAA